MNLRMSLVVVPFVAGILAGCGIDGRPKVVSRAGDPIVEDREPFAEGLHAQFQQAAKAAYPKDIDNPPGPDVQRRFMRTGFELINAGCNSYLEGKSDRQRQVNVMRDAFVPLTALATGVVALTNNGSTVDSDVLSLLAVLTAAGTASFEIYEQRYLFGAKNVDSVRRLVLQAQLEHANLAMEVADEKLSYGNAVRYLIENQMKCSPGEILDLVSQAIEAGNVVPAEKKKDDARPADGDGDGADGDGDGGAAAGQKVGPTFEPIILKVE